MAPKWRHKCPTICKCKDGLTFDDGFRFGYGFFSAFVILAFFAVIGWKIGEWLF